VSGAAPPRGGAGARPRAWPLWLSELVGTALLVAVGCSFVVLDFGFTMPVWLDPHWLYFAAAVGLAAHLLKDRARAWVSN